MSLLVKCHCGHAFRYAGSFDCPQCGEEPKVPGRGWELAEHSVLYWLLVAYRMAHLGHLRSCSEIQRSAEQDADHRLRRSTHPSDAKVVDLLRPISAYVMRACGDQAMASLQKIEQELAIWKLSEAFGQLGAIRCKGCGYPADQHHDLDSFGLCVLTREKTFVRTCPGHLEP